MPCISVGPPSDAPSDPSGMSARIPLGRPADGDARADINWTALNDFMQTFETKAVEFSDESTRASRGERKKGSPVSCIADKCELLVYDRPHVVPLCDTHKSSTGFYVDCKLQRFCKMCQKIQPMTTGFKNVEARRCAKCQKGRKGKGRKAAAIGETKRKRPPSFKAAGAKPQHESLRGARSAVGVDVHARAVDVKRETSIFPSAPSWMMAPPPQPSSAQLGVSLAQTFDRAFGQARPFERRIPQAQVLATTVSSARSSASFPTRRIPSAPMVSIGTASAPLVVPSAVVVDELPTAYSVSSSLPTAYSVDPSYGVDELHKALATFDHSALM